ncbi:MAG: hypothetical protein HY516_00690 [Candidatus Aenigmarchaeota archaeon]|nr:hypothetical protein [Candidatus Aenigmarchaeota archaeon]
MVKIPRHSLFYFSLFFTAAFSFTAVFAAAQPVLSEGVVKFWNTWFNVPVKYLTSWQSILTFAAAPVIIAIFFAYEIWKELGIFHSGAANFWIPLLIVGIMLNNGFWDYVDLFVSNTQMIPALVLSFLALQVTGKLRSKVTSFGYSGIFGGILSYVLDAVGVGIFFGGLGFIFSKGRLGPVVYVLFFAGAAIGALLIWWDKKGRKTGTLKNALAQEDEIGREISLLEAKLTELNKRATAESNPAAKGAIEDEMARVKQRVDRLRAREEVLIEQAA